MMKLYDDDGKLISMQSIFTDALTNCYLSDPEQYKHYYEEGFITEENINNRFLECIGNDQPKDQNDASK